MHSTSPSGVARSAFQTPKPLYHRLGHRWRRAPPDRLAVAVPLCLSWPLSLLTAPELRPLDFLAHDRAWLRDHRLLNSLGLTTASSQAGHRLGLATLPQASSASVGAGPYPGVHGQPLRMDLPVTQPTLHGSLPLQGFYSPTAPVYHRGATAPGMPAKVGRARASRPPTVGAAAGGRHRRALRG